MAKCMTPAELRAVLDPNGPRPVPYWPTVPDAGPIPEYEDRLAVEQETGALDPRAVAAHAYRKQARRCWDRRMRLVEEALRAARKEA